ncbi:MAG: hypothetical protein NXI22_12025 [bacterium]|nr:hypothetical protein [bacterium]
MKIKQFLEHHKITRNPFAEEDAQTDPVFKEHCIEGTFHPTWDKVYGDPSEPATAVVFGEKGSGKTAMRLQIAKHLGEYNRNHPDRRILTIQYDDFNPFLDRFQNRVGGRKSADKVLAKWRLWDHMDAILTLGVTGVVDHALGARGAANAVADAIDSERLAELDQHQARDLLLLALCYDQSTAQTHRDRWRELAKRLQFSIWQQMWDLALGIAWSSIVVILAIVLAIYGQHLGWHSLWVIPLVAGVGWLPRAWRCLVNWNRAWGINHHMRTANHETGTLRRLLMNFQSKQLESQPLPNLDRTDDRYELLGKFQSILQTLGFTGIIVLVDRLDEPHMINGSAELMKELIWPMLDNKFLKQPGIGIKLMLPIELTRFIDREERDFYQRARLDKQNMVASFQWTGEALYDVANARLEACANDGVNVQLSELFDSALSHERLIAAFRQLRVPRHLFKFLYRLLVAHCHAHSDSQPSWQIAPETFERELGLYQREQDASDRGMGA